MEDEHRVKQQEIKVVHKGLFYGLWVLISFPFIMLWRLIRWFWKYISIYLGWIKESSEIERKKRKLHKYLNISKHDDEVI